MTPVTDIPLCPVNQESGSNSDEASFGSFSDYSVTSKYFDVLDALACHENFDCEHDASGFIELKIEDREVSLIKSTVEKYLQTRLVSERYPNGKETQIAVSADEFAFVDELNSAAAQTDIFKQCRAFLDGVIEGMNIAVDEIRQSEVQEDASKMKSSNRLKRKSEIPLEQELLCKKR